MKKLAAFVLSFVCVLSVVGCRPKTGGDTSIETPVELNNPEKETEAQDKDPGETPEENVYVVDIWDKAEREQLDCDTAFEKFWEDETTEYYFSCIKSHYIMVMDSTGRVVDVVTALKEGLITIETLDHYGIQYSTEQKN